jgi:hypothetical protein
MNYFALFYREVVPDFVSRRAVHRDEHLRLAREAHAHGELVLAGALADPPDGALWCSGPPTPKLQKTLPTPIPMSPVASSNDGKSARGPS